MPIEPLKHDYEDCLFCRLLAAAGTVTINHDTVITYELEEDGARFTCADHESRGDQVEAFFDVEAMRQASTEGNAAYLEDSDDGVRCVVRFFKTAPLTEKDLPSAS